MASYTGSAAATRKPSKQEKKGSVYVIEDTTRRRDRERERKGKKK
jgi:hypothetical protein